jgi:hypothetical protein
MKEKLHNEFDRDRIIGYIKRLDLSKSYSVEVRERKARRSLDQNALMWLWLTCIESETGNDRNDLHDYFKKKYIAPKEVEVFGVKELKYTTTDLSTGQFKEYLDKIQAFASTELSITLPNPEDKIWDEFFDFYRDRL